MSSSITPAQTERAPHAAVPAAPAAPSAAVPPQAAGPAAIPPMPSQPPVYPAAAGAQATAPAQGDQGDDAPLPAVPEQPERTGIPGGPLMLTAAHSAVIAGSAAMAAGGIPAVAGVGAVAALGGAARVAYGLRVASRGRYGGYGRGWGRGGGWGGYGRGGRAGGSGGLWGGGSARRSTVGSASLGGGTTRGGASGARPGTGGSRFTDAASGLTGPGGRGAGRGGQLGRIASRRAGGRSAERGPAAAGPVSLAKSGSARPGGAGHRAAGGSGGGQAAGRAGAARAGWSGSRAGQSVAAARGKMARAAHTAQKEIPARIASTGSKAAQAWRGASGARRRARRSLRLWRKRTITLGLATAAAVLAQVLVPWRFVAKRVWVRVWNWRAYRSQDQERAHDERDAAATAVEAAESRAPRADTVNDPSRPDDSGQPSKPVLPAEISGDDVPAGPDQVFARAAEAVANAYGQYSPPSMLAVAAEYEGLPEGIRSAATAIQHLANNTATVYPAHRPVADAISAVHVVLLEAARAADEVAPQFRTLHAADLARFEAPRNGYSGEVMWNIGGRPGDGAVAYQSVFSRSAEEVAGVYARYEPGVMTVVQQEYASLPHGLEHLAAAVQSLAIRSADSYPVNPHIAEMVGLVRHRITQAVSAAQEVLPVFRRAHAADLARHEAPRNGLAAEAMWNV